MRTIIAGFCLGVLSPSLSLAVESAAPNLLAPYYAEALTFDGKPLRLATAKGEKLGVEHASYASADGTVRLSIDRTACDRLNCDLIYEKRLSEHNAKLSKLGGRFSTASATEFVTEWKSGSTWHRVLGAKLPRSLIFWELSVPFTRRLGDEEFVRRVLVATNQQRFSDAALKGETVEVGRWAPSIYQHARELLKRGKTDEALMVLALVVIWSPYSYEAKIDLAENTKDTPGVQASANAVWENAESIGLTTRAAHLLGRAEPNRESIQPLAYGESGLQVVLIPLPPSNIRLVQEAGDVLSRVINVPVRVARLADEWRWGTPDRVYRQGDIQTVILRKANKPVDFTGWTQDQFAKELIAATAKEDALTKFRVQSFLQEAADKPGQYLVDSYVQKLVEAVRPWTNSDRRTLFVGVTESDIYSGQTNFYFSSGWRAKDASASILSYGRMQTAMAGDPYESRKRLVERMAKELVPASLQQLGIPRPTDPSDPYSFSDSVGRLDQKTLVLSAPTREVLDSLRSPGATTLAQAETFYAIGIAEQGQGRLGPAEDALRKALDLSPDRADAWNALGVVLHKTARLVEAETAYDRAIALAPTSPDYLANRAGLRRRQHRLDLAMADARQAIYLSPGHASAWIELGAAAMESGDFRGACTAFGKIPQDDLTANVLVSLGECLAATGQVESGLNALRRAEEKEPNLLRAQLSMAKVLGAKGDFQAALDCENRALALDPTNVIAWSGKGYSLMQMGKLAEAVTTLETAVRLAPDNANAHINLGDAQLRSRNIGPAIKTLERAVVLSPGAADARLLLARAYIAVPWPAKSREQLEVVLQRQPALVPALSLLTVSYLLERNESEASEAYLRLQKQAPDAARNLRAQAVREGLAAANALPE